MPTRLFSLKSGEPPSLEVSWHGFWRDFTVKFQGQTIGTIDSRAELNTGKEFLLPDRSKIFIQWQRNKMQYQLVVLHNGQPVSGSDTSPEMRLKTAYGVIFFIAICNLVIGFLALFAPSLDLAQYGFGQYNLIFGIAYVLLGFNVKQGSKFALGLAIGIFAIDWVVAIFISNAAPASGMVMRIIFIFAMAQGFEAFKNK